VGPKNYILDGGPGPERDGALLGGRAGALQRTCTRDFIALASGECACPAHAAAYEYILCSEGDKTAAMRPFAKSLRTPV